MVARSLLAVITPDGEPQHSRFSSSPSHSVSQHVIDDPHVSRKHLRIYTIVYDSEDPSEVDALIYAEDLSSHGTYWNGSLIGRGNGGFLLSDGDVLKLAPNVSFQYQSLTADDGSEAFDIVQEHEMQVKRISTADRGQY